MTKNILTRFIFESSKHKYYTERLRLIFEQIDFQYKAVSKKYEFNCFNCNDNCCKMLFYHHTLIEYLYVIEGFLFLPKEQQRKLKIRALHTLDGIRKISTTKNMCPLNVDNNCIIYAYRPMICRLHGVSHKLIYPNGKITFGPGCYKFEAQTSEIFTEKLDRTLFYKQLAELESEIRKVNNFTSKLKITIAEMLTIK